MNDYAGLRSIVWLALIETRVIHRGCLQHQGDSGHLGLVHHDRDARPGTTECQLGVVVVPSKGAFKYYVIASIADADDALRGGGGQEPK